MFLMPARKVVADLSHGHARAGGDGAHAQAEADDVRHAADAGGDDEACARTEIDFHPPAAEYTPKSAATESGALLRALWQSPYRLRIALLALGIMAVLVGNVVGQIRLNDWNGAFFDAVAQRNLAHLSHQ